ncbi:ribosomal RNA processing protein 1 homolog A-like [Haliotis rubra]|uniref:ribosomal RNA processing protein 1 homolog A-like n=1 Tax=Haliotis rubra TaxID=36100 RepID=UPI001EE5BE85|nr:ribosomal RNA processing protein 1 homolog A-like [Haliotis rubra]
MVKMAAPSAEIQFAQKLAANEKKIRNKALKKLRKYIHSKSAAKPGLTEEDLIKLWKGLHYCMWMQDKPLLQEELAVHITGLVFSFSNTAAAMKFFKVFLVTEAREWNGIDRQRLDKFMMMTRQMLHEMFVLLRQGQWAEEMIAELATVLRGTTLNTASDNVPDGFAMHLADIYLLELARVGAQQLDGHQILSLLTVFDDYLQTGRRPLVLKRIIGSVYNSVAEQTLERLRREGEKEEAEEDGVDGAKDDSDSGYDEDSEPKLKFDCLLLTDHLFHLGSQERCRGTNRQLLYRTVLRLQNAAAGVVEAADETEVYDPDADLEDAVTRLMNLNPKKKKKRKRQQEAADEVDAQDKMDTQDEVAEETDGDVKKGKKKQKRKLQETASENIAVKKVKLTPSTDSDTKISTETSSTLAETDSPKKKKRKKRKKKKKGSTEVTEQGGDKSVSKGGNSPKGASGDKVQDVKCINTSPPNKLTSKNDSTKETSSSKKSKKKKRLKSTEEKTEGKDVSPPKKTKTEPEATGIKVKVKDGETKIKGKKKKSFPLKEDEVIVSKETKEVNASVSQETKNEKDIVTRDTKDEPLKEGETEIWVPNKKHQAKVKAQEKKVKDKKIKTPKGSTFAKFEKLSTPPAAFVKKAIAKVMKTPLKKTNDAPKTTPEMTASEKKVKFNMKKNTAQKFEDSMTLSPIPAFNPRMTPTQGILKSPASAGLTSAQTSGKKKKKKKSVGSGQNTPVTSRTESTPASNKKRLTRSRAADFF